MRSQTSGLSILMPSVSVMANNGPEYAYLCRVRGHSKRNGGGETHAPKRVARRADEHCKPVPDDEYRVIAAPLDLAHSAIHAVDCARVELGHAALEVRGDDPEHARIREQSERLAVWGRYDVRKRPTREPLVDALERVDEVDRGVDGEEHLDMAGDVEVWRDGGPHLWRAGEASGSA
jgi:hypothetical protein